MNHKNKALFIFNKKGPWMQRISDLICTGHIFYISGQVEIGKVKSLADKFAKNYETGLSKMEQSRKRKNGFASFRFLAWQEDKNEIVHWVLCRTDGIIPEVGNKEKWQDATGKSRLNISGGYELVRLTKPNEPKPTWTWRYNKNHYESLRENVLRVIRNRRDDLLKQLIHEIWRTPGFAGARMQVKAYTRVCWSSNASQSYRSNDKA
jgi:hypothetical protein